MEQLLAKAERYLQQHGSPASLRRAALHYVLKQPGVVSAVIGHRAMEEVRENVSALSELVDVESVEHDAA